MTRAVSSARLAHFNPGAVMHALVSPNGHALRVVRPTPEPTPNRSTPSAYAPIEKVPLQTRDGMRSKAFTVRIEDASTDAGWREVGTVSEDYLLVPNRDVRDMAEEIAVRTGHEFVTARTLFDGRRFALALAFPTALAVEVKVGDPVSVGIMFENSYDGSKRLSASLYVHRLACSNGMVCPQLFGRVRFRHTLASQGWEDEVARVLSVLSTARSGVEQFALGAARLASTQITYRHLRALRQGVLKDVPLTLWARALDRTLQHEENSLYGLMNGATAVLWHDPKQTVRDVEHNEVITTGLLSYATRLN